MFNLCVFELLVHDTRCSISKCAKTKQQCSCTNVHNKYQILQVENLENLAKSKPVGSFCRINLK